MPDSTTKEFDTLPFRPLTSWTSNLTHKNNKSDTGNAPGNRNLSELSNTAGAVSNATGSGNNSSGNSEEKRNKENEGFGIKNGRDVKGRLKVHIKLDLEADIHITAKIREDIAIGLL